MEIYKRLWRFSYIIFSIMILWGIWIFGFIRQYYDNSISGIEGGILIILGFLIIILRETALAGLKKTRR